MRPILLLSVFLVVLSVVTASPILDTLMEGPGKVAGLPSSGFGPIGELAKNPMHHLGNYGGGFPGYPGYPGMPPFNGYGSPNFPGSLGNNPNFPGSLGNIAQSTMSGFVPGGLGSFVPSGFHGLIPGLGNGYKPPGYGGAGCPSGGMGYNYGMPKMLR